MMSIDTEEFRNTVIARIAACLLGDFERGQRAAAFRIPRVFVGVNLIIDCDLAQLSKTVEFNLNELASVHHNRTLRSTYDVKLNTLNGTCHFTAHARNA